MAIGTPVRHVEVGSGSASATTASFTPAANSKLFAQVTSGWNVGSLGADPTISDSLGTLTWTPVVTASYQPAAGRDAKARVFVSDSVGSSPSSMTVTGTSSGAGIRDTCVSVMAITGVADDYDNFVTNTSDAGDPSGTLPSAPAATSAVVGWATSVSGNNSFAPVAGFTELYDVTVAASADYRHEVAYDLSSPAQTLSWTSNNARAIGIVLELVEESGGDKFITGGLYTDPDTFYTGVITKTYEILGSLFVDPDTTYSGTISQGIAGSLFTDPDTFPTGVVSTDYAITGTLFVDPDTFYSGLVERESDENIAGELFVDPDTFHAGAITAVYPITGSLFVDGDTFHAGSLSATYNITGNLFVDPDIFYTGTIEGGADVTPSAMLSFVLLKKRRRAGE